MRDTRAWRPTAALRTNQTKNENRPDTPVWRITRGPGPKWEPAPPPARWTVVISDTHCGSSHGLLPPNFESPETGPIGQNDLQKWLWAQWLGLWEHVDTLPGNFDVVVNGDAIEGFHHRSTEVNGTTVADHVQMFMEIFDPVAAKANRMLFLRGTEAHTGAASEDGIAKHYGACSVTRKKLLASDVMYINTSGISCVYAHHMPTTGREWLKATPMGTAMAQYQLARCRGHHKLPQVLGFAHSHVCRVYRDESAGPAVSFVTPAWQGPTRHTQKLMIPGETTVGAVLLDWGSLDYYGLPNITTWTRRLST
jgi:hypothetical protein